MLLNGTPANTWTSVGNGTYKGIYHELHFIHNDKFFGYGAYQGLSPSSSQLANRDADYGLGSKTGLGVGSELHFLDNSDIGLTTLFDEVGLTPTEAAEFVGYATEATISESDYEFFCCRFNVLGQTASTAAMRVEVTTPPFGWDSPYEPDQILGICENGTIGSVILTCAYNLTSIDPELLDDPDGNETEYVWPVLSTRGDHSSPPVDYIITNYANSAQRTTFTSATYSNGNYGQDLPAYGGDPHAYAHATTDCTDASLTNNATIGMNGVRVQSEHIIERVTIRNFMEFIQSPWMDLEDGLGLQTVSSDLGIVPFAVINDYMNLPYSQWPLLQGQQLNGNTLFENLPNALGSTSNPGVMPNLQASLNNLKSRVWGATVNATSNKIFNKLANNPTTRSTERALSLLRSGMAVFNYINDPNIQTLMGRVHQGIHAALTV
ncbi:hypothetical protein OCU04_007150 [Sclerotinia nivalis]|uniref:Uncharacterized protein n=1 Tax=Sclerotinia nivalis TaxID=352851 RepID=A0A9X0AL81_9HELO|nr:hypothetical protein OCU04_007150 [Sclerotinia nivalis]